jgi:hypothetical protein
VEAHSSETRRARAESELNMPAFARYIGIDYSGAETPKPDTMAQVEGWILGVPGLIRGGSESEGSAASSACDSSVFRLH